jgi:putative oxygen-independent coproporphyrinogen III oxidase
VAAPPVALYIHFPFCLSVCPYCDFVVHGGSAARGPTNRIDATVDALATEIRLRTPAGPIAPLQSVYYGGGTPSLMTPDLVGSLLEVAADAFGVAGDAEITLECNPGPTDRGDLRGFRAAGVNRLSVGAQSFDPAELAALGRRHSPADIAATVAEARHAGFDNISLDLLYDVPGPSLASWQRSLDTTIALAPEHVSAYALTLDDPDAEALTGPAGDHLPLTSGARRWRQRAARRQDESLAADCYALADDVLAAAGYDWYEISNWAQPGRQSRHNLAYWTGAAWEAVGPGAHAFDGGRTRRWNAARLEGYVAALADGRLPPGGIEVAGPAVAAAESAILALRTAAGLPAVTAEQTMSAAALAWGREHGLLETGVDGSVRLTRAGRFLSNELFVHLLPQAEAAAA